MAARVVHLQLDWAFTAHLLWALNLHTTTNRIDHHCDIQWVRTNNIICSTSYFVSNLQSCDSNILVKPTWMQRTSCFAFKYTVVNSDQLWVILKYWPCPCWNHDFWFIRTKRIENYRVLSIMVFLLQHLQYNCKWIGTTVHKDFSVRLMDHLQRCNNKDFFEKLTIKMLVFTSIFYTRPLWGQ